MLQHGVAVQKAPKNLLTNGRNFGLRPVALSESTPSVVIVLTCSRVINAFFVNRKTAVLSHCLGRSSLALPLLIDRAPGVLGFPIDLHKHLIETPVPLSNAAHAAGPLPLDIRCEKRSEPVPLEPRRLMADVDPAREEQVFDVSKAWRKPDIHHHNQPNDLRWRVEVIERAPGLRRLSTKSPYPSRLNPQPVELV